MNSDREFDGLRPIEDLRVIASENVAGREIRRCTANLMVTVGIRSGAPPVARVNLITGQNLQIGCGYQILYRRARGASGKAAKWREAVGAVIVAGV